MIGRRSQQAELALRRIKTSTARVEAETRNYLPQKREPRLSGGGGHFWCQLSGTLAAATGTWPSLTAGSLAGQTVYSSATGSLVALSGTYTILNWWPTSFASGKTTLLLPNGNGTYDAPEQAC